jgi:multidrug efflux pump subunit AcrA (membrane-fusion protein)
MSLQPALPAESPDATAHGSPNSPAAPPAAATPGGSSLAHASSLPAARRGKRTSGLIIPMALIVVVVGAAGAWYLWFRGPQVRVDLVTVPVEYRDLQLKVTERGTLEAKDNHDVKCDVKAGSRGAPKIKSVVENGSQVNVGDLLVEIDDSYLQEQKDQKEIDRLNALKAKILAEQAYPVKLSAVGLAKQNLDKWVKGDFPQQLHAIEGDIQKDESYVLQQEDRTSWAGRMVKKGYMTASQAEAEQANLTSYKLALQKDLELKKVLTEYTDPVNRQTFENAVKDAVAAEQSAKADMDSSIATFKQQDKLYRELMEQIDQCRVKAPYAGIVVYYVPEQTMRGSGSTQSIIAQGEPVQYGQKMLCIPDLSHMMVKVKIHEAFINQLTIGLPVTVRIDAAAGSILKGHVKYLANVASPPDWTSPDVKVYDALVEIDDYVADLKLKPGLSAVCTIYTKRREEHVLAVPVQAVLSPMERGARSRCFVMTPHGPEAREVEVGMSDETHVQIKSGLQEGDRIVMDPRVLLSEKDKRVSSDADKGMPGGRGKQDAPGKSGGKGGKPQGPGGPGAGGQAQPPMNR